MREEPTQYVTNQIAITSHLSPHSPSTHDQNCPHESLMQAHMIDFLGLLILEGNLGFV